MPTKKATKKVAKKAIKRSSPYAMTEEQKQFFNQVIRPTLIQLAIDDELPSDMNEIGSHFFEKATEKFNEEMEPAKKRKELVERLSHYISDEDAEAALTRMENADDETTMDDVVIMWYPLEHMGGLTVEEFMSQYL